MLNAIERVLASVLTERCAIGQILILRKNKMGFVVSHRDDESRADLEIFRNPGDATEIARHDDAGDYRPLKTAPNLRHGWKLELADLSGLRLALDLFYPGRLAAFLAAGDGKLASTSFRETLSRQSGMYHVAAKISDAQSDALIARFCRSDGGCLRTIVWKRDAEGTLPSTGLPPEKYEATHDQTGRNEPIIPLLCQEACNLLVSEARNVVKAEAKP